MSSEGLPVNNVVGTSIELGSRSTADAANAASSSQAADSAAASADRAWKFSNDAAASAAAAKTSEDNINVLMQNTDWFSYIQRNLLAEKLKKLREGEKFTVTWYGDSNSVRDSENVQTQFRQAMYSAYGNGSVGTISRATAGFSAKNAFEAYTTNHEGDVSLINFGTNDASAQYGFPLIGNIEQYLVWIEKLIVRELQWGHPVVLVTPLPLRFDKAYETYITSSPSDPYPTVKRIDAQLMGSALKYLAEKYTIPVIDSTELMASYRDNIYASDTQSINVGTPFGDPVHLILNASTAWGTKIAAAFIGGLVMRKTVVSDGSQLTIRKGYDPIAIKSARSASNIYKYYPPEIEAAFAYGDKIAGNRALNLIAGEAVTWAFFAETDELIAWPILYVSTNSVVNIYIDGNNIKTPKPLDLNRDYAVANDISLVVINRGYNIVNQPIGYLKPVTKKEENNHLRVNSRGWHTITVSVSSGDAYCSGVEFWGQSRLTAEQARKDAGYIYDWTVGDITTATRGLTYYAFTAATGKPPGVTAGIFTIREKSSDNSIATMTFIETAPVNGRAWTMTKLAGVWGGWTQFWTDKNTTVDANGFLKKASPIVKLFGDGSSELNDQSQGVTTERISEGVYRVSGTLGFNSDAEWGGVDGGIEIPTDRNKLPLVWVDYEVDESGDLLIKTFHRANSSAPTFAQNKITGYKDGQPIDIPAGRWVDLRVEMPAGDEPEPVFEPEPIPEPEVVPDSDQQPEVGTEQPAEPEQGNTPEAETKE